MIAANACAFDYTPIPLSLSISEHDLIVLGTVESSQPYKKLRTNAAIALGQIGPQARAALPALRRLEAKVNANYPVGADLEDCVFHECAKTVIDAIEGAESKPKNTEVQPAEQP